MRPFIHCLYFICERKFYARSHVRITRQRKSTLRQVVEVASSSKYLISQVACIAGVFFGHANVFARESAMLKPKRGGKVASPPFPSFAFAPIFHCHKIKDGGYNNANTNKVSPTQNTPALQAISQVFIKCNTTSRLNNCRNLSIKYVQQSEYI